MNELKQMAYIGFPLMGALSVIDERLGGAFAVGGSLSLVAAGLLKRQVGDLDIIVYNKRIITAFFCEEKYNLRYCASSMKNVSHKDRTPRWSFEIDSIRVCAFYDENPREYVKLQLVNGLVIKVANPKHAIIATKNFITRLMDYHHLMGYQIKSLRKHTSDLVEIYTNLPKKAWYYDQMHCSFNTNDIL